MKSSTVLQQLLACTSSSSSPRMMGVTIERDEATDAAALALQKKLARRPGPKSKTKKCCCVCDDVLEGGEELSISPGEMVTLNDIVLTNAFLSSAGLKKQELRWICGGCAEAVQRIRDFNKEIDTIRGKIKEIVQCIRVVFKMKGRLSTTSTATPSTSSAAPGMKQQQRRSTRSKSTRNVVNGGISFVSVPEEIVIEEEDAADDERIKQEIFELVAPPDFFSDTEDNDTGMEVEIDFDGGGDDFHNNIDNGPSTPVQSLLPPFPTNSCTSAAAPHSIKRKSRGKRRSSEELEDDDDEDYVVHQRQQRKIPRIPLSLGSRTVDNIYGFDIVEVLNSSRAAKQIIDNKIQENLFILRSDRQVIAAVLVEAIILHLGTSPSKEALEQLARQLVKLYPSFGDPRKQEKGYEMWFYNSNSQMGPTGFIEERLKNQRRRRKEKETKVIVSDTIGLEDWASEMENENPDPTEDTFLNPVQFPESVFQRRTIIRRLRAAGEKGVDKLVEIMPPLFHVQGLIIQDFNLRHPNLANKILNKWPLLSNVLLDYAEQSQINYAKKLDLVKPASELNENSRMLLAFCLLPFVLPSCGRKAADDLKTGPGKKKRMQDTNPKRLKFVKASDSDVIESMIQFEPAKADIPEFLETNKQSHPFILALGSSASLNISQYFVIIGKVAVTCGTNFLDALDTCFKSFTVLSLPFPQESANHWIFISHGVAGRPHDHPVAPGVQALIGQVMTKI